MSLEITLYTKKATKQKLIAELKNHGFDKVNHILDAFNTPDHLNYMWFSTKHYESFVGVEVTVIKSSLDDQRKYKCSEWILHTRTRSSGSYKDKEKQNIVIKEIRKLFGGTFYNDWYGTNTYTKLTDYPKLSAPERGLSLMKSNLKDKISRIKYSLDHLPKNLIHADFNNIEDKPFKEHLQSLEPSLAIYNAMFPFLVSLIEFLFKESFLIMIRYLDSAKEIIEKENLKVPLRDVLKVSSGELLVENIIADSFTFQNLGQTNKAFKKYLDIDIAKVLSCKKKVGKRIIRIYKKIEEIIEIRHSIVHHFGFYDDLDKSMFIDDLDTINMAIKLFLDHLECKFNWKLDVL
jgi:hypothetical protein